ncbi:hypothetical protein PanWU01x14_098070 [Parasponia andersonii]|uniref:Uncharacterized protein n=1 Tax=Parasponia andersonii TaxID=3476 RepID=A0A2P5D4N6_PARAD|nr:hypothetical protein PanWU01x14_098070 [Parasponia andersonii]
MHRRIVENKFPLTVLLQTSLVDVYAKCKESNRRGYRSVSWGFDTKKN